MKFLRFCVPLVLLVSCAAFAQTGKPVAKTTTTYYLIANNDLPYHTAATSGSVFTISSTGLPQNPVEVSLGSSGSGGGFFNANRVSVLNNSDDCAYLSVGGSDAVGGVSISSLQDVGNFLGSPTDTGVDNGIGLVNNGTYLWANFTSSNTIGTYSILSGCALSFIGDISVLGKNGGNAKGMAVHGNMLVVTYGDGSIESFNISGGIPVSNGDLQNATGFLSSRFPTGVDITQDGHYAVFGDQSSSITVEVSDISSGKLTPTVLYSLGSSGDSSSVFLSPDETLLYIANTGIGKVSAAFFNSTTGAVTVGCSSGKLKGFDTNWIFLDSPVTELNSGTGSVVYLAEFGTVSGIAVVNVTSTGSTCTLTEQASSPVLDPSSTTLLSIGVYPPRQF
jgi:hypothetical protein